MFPVSIPALAPLYRYAPLIWMTGVVFLWLTRYTHQLGKRWGRTYYVLSALIRPSGVLLIAVGWLALYAPPNVSSLPKVDWLPRGNWTDILCLVATVAFSAFGIWALIVLNMRRSFLFRHWDDRLVTHGPYAIVRHPQFLSVIGLLCFGTRLFNPAAFSSLADVYYHALDANWALFTVALWLLSIVEERELVTHFGEEYKEYARRVPRLFPN